MKEVAINTEYVIQGYQPAALFRFFEELSAIPRGSGKEQQLSDYLVAFAKNRGLRCHQDSFYNVVIYKPAAKGMENLPAVMLQGHQDMVCEKNTGVAHDFEKDGIKLQVKDDFLSAEGTTLGADNGIAVAMMLAVLDDPDLIHPPLECVFTVSEEIGLIGAKLLDGSLLSAKTMINLDSEEEGIATVSCAGGLRMELSAKGSFQKPGSYGVKIAVSGLYGGHSGTDIHLERANANKLMGRMLYHLYREVPFLLCQINGGNKDNAIPREAAALLAFDTADQQAQAIALLKQQKDTLINELYSSEPRLCLEIRQCDPADKAFSPDFTQKIIGLIDLAPDGVLSRNLKQGGFVVASINLGVVCTDGEKVSAVFAPRSSVSSLQEEIKERITLLADTFGFSVACEGEYPGWAYAENSPIRTLFKESYRRLFGKELRCEAIHAGLECGLFQEKLPGLDAIAIGPEMFDVHTPEERLNLKSCERTYRLVCAVLSELAGQAYQG